ncbi:MAG: replication initiator protein [Microvirus sp.]|nr:MAG: replication initiator protein [Microvirus sp.]
MPCHYPARAYRLGDRDNRPCGVSFDTKKGDNVLAEIKVPCGKCLGCKKTRIRDWALRCQNEAKMHDFNYFITLTYDEKNLPDGNTLWYNDFQAFMKKARRWTSIHDWKTKKQFENTKIRFFMCGEYGALKRPHYHVLLFNFPIPDLQKFKEKNDGTILYTSEMVSMLWNNRGFITIGQVEYASAAYVAQYCVKKLGTEKSDYEMVNLETGETITKQTEMIQMSRRPGIGATWYDKYEKQVFPIDRVIANGKQVSVPKYYTQRYKKENPEGYEETIINRYERNKNRMADNTEERLMVKEECLKSKMDFYGGKR